MVRISRLTDYGIQLMAALSRAPERSFNAGDLSTLAAMPEPTVKKLLKALARGGLLVSARGVHGGYRLARAAQQITIAEIIGAIEGPIAMTECTAAAEQVCERKHRCPVQQNWQQVNQAIHGALANLTLSQMAGSLPAGWSGAPTGGGER